MEHFNREMIEQFLAHQRRVQSSYQKWEVERQRQHEQSMDRWRQESRAHEKEMFGIFVKVMSECNAALGNIANLGNAHRPRDLRSSLSPVKPEANGDFDDFDEEGDDEDEDEEEEADPPPQGDPADVKIKSHK